MQTEQKRQCNECNVCCYIARVESKPPCSKCKYLGEIGCSIFGEKERSEICNNFRCVWLDGVGDEKDRPDKNGVMISVNRFNGGEWIFVMDLRKDAHMCTGKNIILKILEKINIPVIIVDYDNLEKGKGDYVIVPESLKYRCSKIMGKFIEKISYLDKYELVIS